MHDAVLAEMQFGELPIRIGEIKSYGALRLRPAAAHFRPQVFEAVRQVDAAAEFLARNRIDDWFAPLLDQAGHGQSCTALLHVNREIDVSENGLMYGRESGREDVENRGAWLRVLTADDAKNAVALGLAPALVHNRLHLAVPEMDRPGPGEHAGEAQAIERRLAMVALVDLNADHRLAIAVRRQRIELAGAAIGAVAIGEFTPFEFPFDHRDLPFPDPDPWGSLARRGGVA